LAARLTDAAAEEYGALLDEAEGLLASPERLQRRSVDRLRRELRRIEDRDPFPPKERAKVRRAIERLSARVDAADEAVAR